MLSRALFAALVALVSLTACGGGKLTPDEFAVVGRAPLALPPEAELAPPRPGEPRAQEIDPGRQAFEALFPGQPYTNEGAKSDGEALLLSNLFPSDPDVRANFNHEKLDVVKKRLILAEMLAAGERTYRPDNVTVVRAGPGGN